MSDAQTGKPAQPEASVDPLHVPIERIPLPPEELWAELANDPEPPPSGAPKPVGPAPEVATLDFVSRPEKIFQLNHPFRLDGRVIDAITVRPLSVAETGSIVTAASGERLDTFTFYAVMTGLPAPVIRALPGADGERITDAAYDFLPQFMKGGAG